MNGFFQITDVSHVIQLAVAPVFLLAGISGTLSVLTIRLGRIVDRGRQLDDRFETADSEGRNKIDEEQQILSRRAELTNLAVKFCTACALLICLVIGALFIGAFLNINLSYFVAFLFITAMAFLLIALLFFMREIELSTSAFRFGKK